jgi:hypothetical protein
VRPATHPPVIWRCRKSLSSGSKFSQCRYDFVPGLHQILWLNVLITGSGSDQASVAERPVALPPGFKGSAVPGTHLPAPPFPSFPASPARRKPICQGCGKEMRIVSVEPYPRYTNVELHSYLCDCGRSEGFFVAQGD